MKERQELLCLDEFKGKYIVFFFIYINLFAEHVIPNDINYPPLLIPGGIYPIFMTFEARPILM